MYFDCLIQEILCDHWVVTEVCPADKKLKRKQNKLKTLKSDLDKYISVKQ